MRVGRAFGARDPDGVTRAGWVAFALGVGFMGLTAILMFLAPRQLVAIFLDLEDPQNAAVIGFALSFLTMAAIFQLADGAQAVGAGMLRGLQDTKGADDLSPGSAIGASACRSASRSASSRRCGGRASGSASPPASRWSPS